MQKKRPKTSIFKAFFLIGLYLALAPLSGMADAISRPNLGFAIKSLPEGFIELPVRNIGTEVTLIFPKNARFPTFNILVKPGTLVIDPSTSPKLQRETLESFKSVGMTGVSGRGNYIQFKIGDLPALGMQHEYSRGNEKFISMTSLVPGQNQYYILTIVDLAADFEKHADLREQLISSFRVIPRTDSPPSQANGSAGKQDANYFLPTFLSVMFVFVCLAAYLIAKYFLKRRL